MLAPMRRLATLCFALMLLLTACRDAGPEEVARDFVRSLVAYAGAPAPEDLEQAFELLDRPTREALVTRAKGATGTVGAPLAPWELLRFDGFVRGDRLVRVEQVGGDGDRARVVVATAWAVPPGAGGPAEAPEAHEVVLVREDGAWRVSLPSIAAAASGAP